MLKMLQRLIGEDIDLRWLPGAQVDPVHIDPAQIDQILANLVVNARDAIEGVGRVTIETGRASFDEEYCRTHEDFVPGRYALLAVSDDGCGMDEQTRRQVFDPFFTTKGVGEGTGLGLATVYGIVRQNGGFINVYSEPGEGTTFRIYLPVRRGESERVEPAAWQTRQVRGAGQTVLLVEDEPAILDLTRRMLLRMGYEVIPAATPGEALQRGREHAGTIHLLITDVVMPEMDGRALARQLLSLYPQMHRLFMSGYTANVIAHHGVLDEGVHFIQKPFSQSELAEKISDIFDGEE
jgi:CheY-like chemotaxis protein